MLPRVIRYFIKSDEKLAGEHVLLSSDLAKLQSIFVVSPDNPMYDSFPINRERAEVLAVLFQIDFELGKFDYFLEYEGD